MAKSSDKTPLLSPKEVPSEVPTDEAVVEPLRSRNVAKMFAYNFMDGASFSVWQSQVLQVLLYRLEGNTAVGWVSGAAGAAQVVAALVAGYASDVLQKQVVCRAAAFCGLVGIAISLYGVYELYPPLFYISGAVWGVYMGLANSSSEAIFADSIPSGRRAAIYNWKWIVQILCWCIGYLMCLILFLKLGNHWHVDTMQTILYIGLGMHPIALTLLASLKDKDSLKHDESLADQATKEEAKKKEAALPPAEETETALDEIEKDEEPSAEVDGIGLRQRIKMLVSWRTVPYFVCTGDFIMALGSGMTLRYIPLFFVNDYNINPALLMGVYLIISVSTSLIAIAARFVADRYIGRVPAILAARLFGTTLLMYMAVVPENTPASALGVMLAFFVVRNGCMNSTFGMSRSVIMDCVHKDNRGKWAAVESFSSFTWAGSATLGGYLADAHGYKYTFLITAVMHYIGSCMLIPAWIGSRKLEAVVMRRSRERREKDAVKTKITSRRDVKSKSRSAIPSTLSLQYPDAEVCSDGEDA